ncbi:unnamed protein product [Dicrocoelium dendriticum]|nr:unnamed protein product [Dicrocoelium dendriticum]
MSLRLVGYAPTICVLMCVLVPLFISVDIGLFVTDQYAYHWYLKKAGLPDSQKTAKKKLINRTEPAEDKHGNTKLQWAQGQTAYLTTVINVVAISAGTPVTLMLGHLSDRYGRRFVLLWIMLSEGLHLGSQAIIVMFSFNAWALILPTLFEGVLSGGLLSAIAQLSVCAVDITEDNEGSNDTEMRCNGRQPAKRWLLLAVLDGTACLCLAIGDAIAGTVLHKKGFTITSLTSLVIFTPGVVFVYFLPETMTKLRQQHDAPKQDEHNRLTIRDTTPEQLAHWNTMQMFRNSTTNLKNWFQETKTLLLESGATVVISVAILFLFSIAAMVDMHYGFLYLMGAPFYWNSESVGLFGGLSDALSAVISMALVFVTVTCNWKRYTEHPSPSPSISKDVANKLEVDTERMPKWTRHQSCLLLYLAMGLSIISLSKIAMAIAHLFSHPLADAIVYTALALRLTKSLPIPVIRALIATCSNSNQQGRLYSFCAFAQRIGLLISLTALPLVYAATVATFAGAVYIVSAILLGIGLLMTFLLPLIHRQGVGQHLVKI